MGRIMGQISAAVGVIFASVITVLGSIIVAIIALLAGLRRDTKEKIQKLETAQIEAVDNARKLVSADMWARITELTAAARYKDDRIDALERRIDSLRVEKDQRIEVLEHRVDQLEDENVVLRRELAKRGIPIPRTVS